LVERFCEIEQQAPCVAHVFLMSDVAPKINGSCLGHISCISDAAVVVKPPRLYIRTADLAGIVAAAAPRMCGIVDLEDV